MTGSHSLWDAQTPPGFWLPNTPSTASASPSRQRPGKLFLPALPRGSPVQLHTMEILDAINAENAINAVSAACCIHCELTGQGLPLADMFPAIKPTRGVSDSRGSRLHSGQGLPKGQTVFFLARHLLHVRLPPWAPLSTPYAFMKRLMCARLLLSRSVSRGGSPSLIYFSGKKRRL